MAARELWLLRHGKAEPDARSGRDFDRALAKRGRKDAAAAGEWLRAEGHVPDLVVSSPAERARETALLAAEGAGLDPGAVTFDPRIYDAALGDLLRVLADLPAGARRVLLVGHVPGLEDLLLHLGGAAVAVPGDGKLLPTAGLAGLSLPASWDAVAGGSGRLVTIRRPKDA